MTQVEFFNRYKFDSDGDLLGVGGFGKVYKAFDDTLNRYIAIKISEVRKGQESLSLKKEVELAASLPIHKNISHYEECYRFKLQNGLFDYGILQYYPMGNLSQLVKSKKLTLEKKEQIANGVISGIQHLHNNNVVHRDLKSANILIAEGYHGEYVPKIADFGLSKQFAQNENSYFSNSFAGGSLLYVAPEQLEGKELRKNVDLWSFGVVLFELFVGETPFRANVDDGSETARAEIINKIRNATLPASITSVPSPWQEIIRVCLVTNPSNRVKSIEEVQDIVNGKISVKKDSDRTEVDTRPVTDTKEKVYSENKGDRNESANEKPLSGWLIFLLISLVLGYLVWWGLTSGSKGIPSDQTKAEEIIKKDQFYYSVSEYERKKNPNISNDEVAAKVDAYRAEPEKYYAMAYKEYSGGKKIDKKTLQRVSELDGIPLDPNKLSPSEINLDDNDKIDLKRDDKKLSPEKNAADEIENSMVRIPGGTFLMGCTGEQGQKCFKEELPAHEVSVQTFYISKFEVTQNQWRSIVGNNPSEFKNCDQCPVENISWNDAQNFIKKLNVLTGKKYRLPKENEWEYAARGGQPYIYSGSSKLENVGWCAGNDGFNTKPVGKKDPNVYGLYDMSGNVWEWCSDWFKGYPGSSGVKDHTGSFISLRGGSFEYHTDYCSVTNRRAYKPSGKKNNLGFRLAANK